MGYVGKALLDGASPEALGERPAPTVSAALRAKMTDVVAEIMDSVGDVWMLLLPHVADEREWRRAVHQQERGSGIKRTS